MCPIMSSFTYNFKPDPDDDCLILSPDDVYFGILLLFLFIYFIHLFYFDFMYTTSYLHNSIP